MNVGCKLCGINVNLLAYAVFKLATVSVTYKARLSGLPAYTYRLYSVKLYAQLQLFFSNNQPLLSFTARAFCAAAPYSLELS